MISFRNRYPLLLLGLWMIGALVLIFVSILFCDGHLIYTLDDPYIHLAVAENILHGGYGINAGEYSAPSSSIIYPFILALTELAGLGSWGPLVINTLSMGFSVLLIGGILDDFVFSKTSAGGTSSWSTFFKIALGLLVCMSINSWGLVMTGMEHSLHVLAVLLVVRGFLNVVESGSGLPLLSLAAIILMPFIRFEGMAMSLLSIGALVYLHHHREALFATSCILLGFIGWNYFTHFMGLPILPSSVLVKSDIASTAIEHRGNLVFFENIAKNIETSTHTPQGIFLLLLLIAIMVLTIISHVNRKHKTAVIIGGLSLFSGAAHVMFGKYGWFSRYEIYIFTLLILSLILLSSPYLIHERTKSYLILFLALISAQYVITLFLSPFASRNIFRQQYQMHRFAVEYWNKPIAVNDIGWASYQNGNYVLDLFGLGSEEARTMRTENKINPTSLQALARKHNVALIMVYDFLFKSSIPHEWVKVATLHTATYNTVDFFATSFRDRKELLHQIRRFSYTLPKGTILDILE